MGLNTVRRRQEVLGPGPDPHRAPAEEARPDQSHPPSPLTGRTSDIRSTDADANWRQCVSRSSWNRPTKRWKRDPCGAESSPGTPGTRSSTRGRTRTATGRPGPRDRPATAPPDLEVLPEVVAVREVVVRPVVLCVEAPAAVAAAVRGHVRDTLLVQEPAVTESSSPATSPAPTDRPRGQLRVEVPPGPGLPVEPPELHFPSVTTASGSRRAGRNSP